METKKLVGFGLLALAACGGGEGAAAVPADFSRLGDQGGIRFEVVTDAAPATGVNVLHVTMRDASSGAVVDAQTLDVRAIMPAMGHGASVQPTAAREGVGTYRVDDVVFSMPGRWDVTCAAATGGTVRDTVTVSFDVQ